MAEEYRASLSTWMLDQHLDKVLKTNPIAFSCAEELYGDIESMQKRLDAAVDESSFSPYLHIDDIEGRDGTFYPKEEQRAVINEYMLWAQIRALQIFADNLKDVPPKLMFKKERHYEFEHEGAYGMAHRFKGFKQNLNIMLQHAQRAGHIECQRLNSAKAIRTGHHHPAQEMCERGVDSTLIEAERCIRRRFAKPER